MKHHGSMGLTQSFRIIRFRDATGLEADDLLERTVDGYQIRSEMVDKIIEDTIHRNKWTRRGLGMVMHQSLIGHVGTHTPPEVVYTPTTNPFQALFLAADDPTLNRMITGNVGDTITKSTNQIYMVNGDFSSADEGSLVFINGGSREGNKGFRVITQVLSATTITVGGYASQQGFAADVTENFGGLAVWHISRAGDARVEWSESDGQYDTLIPQGNASGHALFERGSRACLISDTSGILKRVSVSYVTTAPYREVELLFYATGVGLVRTIVGDPSDSIVAASNTITMTNGAFVPGDVGKILKISGASVSGNNGQRRITVWISSTQIQTDGQYAADANENFVSTLVSDGVYEAPNETGYKGLDYLPIKSIGLAEGIACGNGESSNRIGIRSILGRSPTLQGVCDRTYVHEGSGLHGYVGTETLGTYGDGYVASSSVGNFTGDKAFDGYVQGEGLYGEVDLGDKWQSIASTNHSIGRVWSTTTAKQLTGIRVTFPPGENKNNCPDNFYIQYLDASKVGGDPSLLQPTNDAHWTTIGSQMTDQADTMFANGKYGVEYTFSIPGNAVAYGVRLSNLNAYAASQAVMVAELYAFEAGPTVEFVAGYTDKMRIATLQAPLATDFRNFYFGSLSTTNMATVADTMNKKLRGYQLEALRSNFGYLWLRGTVQGDNSYVTLDSVTNGSTANTTLEMPVSLARRTQQGTTQPIMKLPCDALAIIYRFGMSGDLPTS